ncbi:MAG: porin [Nitrosomonadales bacterium]|nr:porin [Nitrosomonadales bacterium]
MQKKLMKRNGLTVATLAAAMALPVSALADTANVTVYGQANVSYDIVSNGNGPTAATQGISTNKVSSNVSRLGFKGTEDLGDGLSAIWQIEQQVNLDDTTGAGGTGTLATRNTFAGLASDSIGKVILGRHDTPYKLATRKLDVFADNIADSRALTGGVAGKSAVVAFDGRQTNIVAYTSPSMNGFTGSVAYVAGAETATLATQTKGSAWSLAGMYDMAPFYASLAYEIHNFGTNGAASTGTMASATALAGSKETATKLGLGYTLDAFNVGFAYEKSSDNTGAANTNQFGHSTYYLSGKYSFGNDAVKVAYTKQGNVKGVSNTGASHISLGYDHNLSKRTSVYALYSGISNQTGASYGFSNNGSGFSAAAGAGAKLSAWSFGMKHSF